MEEETKKSNVKLVWGIVILIISVVGIGLVVYGLAVPESNAGALFFWGLGTAAFFSLIGGGFHYFTKRGKVKQEKKLELEEKLPTAISTDQARRLAEEKVKDRYFDYFKTKKIDGSGQFGKSGKTTIYTLVGKGVYDDVWYCVLINQNYPTRDNLFIVKGPDDSRIAKYQNQLAIDPSEEPTEDKVTLIDPLTGRSFIRETKEPPKPKEKPKKKEERKGL